MWKYPLFKPQVNRNTTTRHSPTTTQINHPPTVLVKRQVTINSLDKCPFRRWEVPMVIRPGQQLSTSYKTNKDSLDRSAESVVIAYSAAQAAVN